MLGCAATGRSSTDATTRHPLDPAQLAARIEGAQEAVDDTSAPGARLRQAALSEQLAFRQLTDHPRLRHPTLTRLSVTARLAATAALRAAVALSKIVPAERRFPDWRIVTPPPPELLLTYLRTAASRYRLRWQYLAAIELVETRMGRIRGLSPAGAQGPMQFMPATWAEYGRGSINNQHDAITAGARFLAANGGRRNIAGALLHYNPSQSYVGAVEAYAQEMRRDSRAFYGYYNWQVLYRTTKGTFLLPIGYPRVRPQRLPG
jgi:soluble lytic murein transglycosylase-like protein